MQLVALAVIAIATIVIAVVCGLLYKRATRFMDEVEETMRVVNRVAPKLEEFIDAVEKEVAAVRSITGRLARVSERVEALTEETVDAVQAFLHPMKRLSKTVGVLKAAIAGLVAGAAVLRRRRDVPDESQEEPTSNHSIVGERSAS